MRVLITRSVQDAPALVGALLDRGHHPVVVPLVEIRFAPDDLARLAATPADVVLVTSAVAADALAIAAPRAWAGARWAAVGPATAQRLRELGLPVHLVPPRATADDLLQALGDPAGATIVWPRGDLAPAGPVERLRAAGATVHDVVAYTNGAPVGAERELRAALPVDVTTLFSGSAADRLAAAVGPERRAELGRVVVVGPSTAEACARHGVPVARIAEPHTVAGVLSAIEAVG